MREVKMKPVGPIYTVAITWLLYACFFPLYKLWHFIVAILVTLIIWSISKKIFKPQIIYVEEPEPEPVSYGPEVDAIVAEGRLAQSEMGRLYASIKDNAVRMKMNQLMQISDKIVQNAIDNPGNVPQIKKFLNYYLPTTIKLLNAYDRMSDQGIEGVNISGSMSRIEAMLDTAVEAFKKQLDSLFANQALDIETDIEVMNAMLAREGLAGGDFGNKK
ncbi:MAG: 5-bromo-4-chloroindolyl phosphate hydrolysis family protein [Oscillospiraceae bacterium]